MTQKCTFAILLLIGALSASSLVTSQAYVEESITKPATPEFSVQLVSHPYDVPPKTTTTVDQYTGKETSYTQPGYRVENKSIEITIKNQPFTPYNLTTHTIHDKETGELYTYNQTSAITLFYNINVKGHYGDEWKTVGGKASYPDGPISNVQFDSEYTVISIKTDDYPNDALLDFRVQAAVGHYVAYGRNIVIFGYDFYGQESDWSSIQQLTLGSPQTPTPAPTTVPTFMPTESPTLPPASTQSPTATPTQPNPQTETNLTLSWEQEALIICIAVIAALVAALVLTRRKKQ